MQILPHKRVHMELGATAGGTQKSRKSQTSKLARQKFLSDHSVWERNAHSVFIGSTKALCQHASKDAPLEQDSSAISTILTAKSPSSLRRKEATSF